MAVTYTNRKGRTYYLCQGLTKKGKPRYFFSREPKGNVLEQIPEGYEIRESVNGNVSLAKARPIELLDSEVTAVQKALGEHPKARLYQVDIKPRQITVYESIGPDIERLLPKLKDYLGSDLEENDLVQRLQEEQSVSGQFSPVMRFILTDKEKRLFEAQRMSYRGSVDDWINVKSDKTIEELASSLIPTLGTDGFFELY